MILEVAVLNVKSGQEEEFEKAFGKAQSIISSMQGYLSHSLQKCIEKSNRYILLVNWASLQDHTEGFRKSSEYEEWRRLLYHFQDSPPEVVHYTSIYGNHL